MAFDLNISKPDIFIRPALGQNSENIWEAARMRTPNACSVCRTSTGYLSMIFVANLLTI